MSRKQKIMPLKKKKQKQIKLSLNNLTIIKILQIRKKINNIKKNL